MCKVKPSLKGNVNSFMFFEVLMAKIILSNVKENPQNEGEQKDMGWGHK